LFPKEHWDQVLTTYKEKVNPIRQGAGKNRGKPEERSKIAGLERLAAEVEVDKAQGEITLQVSAILADDLVSCKTFYYCLVSTVTVINNFKVMASLGSINLDVEGNYSFQTHEGLDPVAVKARSKTVDVELMLMIELCKTLFAIYLNDTPEWKYYPARPGLDVVPMFHISGY
jgi:hypothetical protein